MKCKITAIIFLAIFYFTQINNVFSHTKSLRIISLAPSTTEILFALGLNEEIIAVSSFCTYPPQAKNKEKVGTFSQPNIEKILFLKPDIIFCTGLEQAPAVAKLKQLKLNVFISDPKNIEELFQSILKIGELTRREKEAKALVDGMRMRIVKIISLVEKVPKEKRPKVFIEVWYNPLTTVGKKSFINELIESAGGINIASDIQAAYGAMAQEAVLTRNPDCIILAYMGKTSPIKQVMGRPGWKNISAVKNERVYNDINPDALLRSGPRTVEALEALYKKLYPQ